MAGAAYSDTYRLMREQLVALRKDAGLSQAQLAGQLGKPPSFVAKYELGERRLDVVELLVILKCIGAPPEGLIDLLGRDAPANL
ncbi:helix-turn-helix domain-containing protein [Pseudooceanicola algae]|uniref:helix-turn-helix domain-containing protein n=1 Tax=Pseudooceanicola algae TaxID=1537215 RepID=UPI001E57BABA|nr:helix-turn-helix transcriptional regulator [Pseudooceanicola algae]